MKKVIKYLEYDLKIQRGYAQIHIAPYFTEPYKTKLIEQRDEANERITQLQEAIKILNAQIESQNVTGNECEKEVCEHENVFYRYDLSEWACTDCRKVLDD